MAKCRGKFEVAIGMGRVEQGKLRLILERTPLWDTRKAVGRFLAHDLRRLESRVFG